jgi:hypothetical protein
VLDDDVLQAITLSAPIASGKTVTMTALIERVLFGKGGLEDFDHPEFGTEPDAVFLWLADSPQLNQQSLDEDERGRVGQPIDGVPLEFSARLTTWCHCDVNKVQFTQSNDTLSCSGRR